MTEQFKSDNPSTPQQSESDLVGLIKMMQQQLAFLEKKIDILLSQSKERNFSKPSRPFDRPYRPGRHQDKRGHGEDSRERSFNSGPYFEKRQGDEQRGFGGPKKNYSNERENPSNQDRYFKKKYDDKKGGFDPRKKNFFHKRKDH